MKKKKVCEECGNMRIIVDVVEPEFTYDVWDREKGEIAKRKVPARTWTHVCRTCHEKDKVGAWMLKREYR